MNPNEYPEAIDLTDGITLKGYGRRQHGLNGKDADLDEGGQIIIKEAWWFPESVSCTYVHWYTVNDDYDYAEKPVTLSYPVTYEDGQEEELIAELFAKITELEG